MNIAKNHVVSIHYTLKNDEGQTLDSSSGGDPLTYLQGMGQLISGLEKALEGKIKGDKSQVTIAPQDAYGEINPEMVRIAPKTEFEDSETIDVGTQFQIDTKEDSIIFTVTEVREQEFVLDGNHPLAGQTLHFDVEITEVRAATAEEIEHGHVHEAGCSEH